jgi:opacity protein-like surface antigen
MKSMLIGAALAAALTGLAGAASAAPAAPAEAKHNSCFLSSNWSGWHAPDDKTLYLRVNLHDIYRVDLSSPSPLLTWPDTHLVNVMRGSSYICAPLDLQLSVADNGGGGRDFLFVKAITKLTPEQVAGIPKKDLP